MDVKKQSLNKKATLRLHAKKRAKERYGIALNKTKRNLIISMIVNQETTFLYKSSLRVSVHKVVIDGIECKVVYDTSRHEIVTFLPPTGRGFDYKEENVEQVCENCAKYDPYLSLCEVLGCIVDKEVSGKLNNPCPWFCGGTKQCIGRYSCRESNLKET